MYALPVGAGREKFTEKSGVAVGRILSIGLDGNDAVWLELLVTAFESEENCMGYVQNPGTLVP